MDQGHCDSQTLGWASCWSCLELGLPGCLTSLLRDASQILMVIKLCSPANLTMTTGINYLQVFWLSSWPFPAESGSPSLTVALPGRGSPGGSAVEGNQYISGSLTGSQLELELHHDATGMMPVLSHNACPGPGEASAMLARVFKLHTVDSEQKVRAQLPRYPASALRRNRDHDGVMFKFAHVQSPALPPVIPLTTVKWDPNLFL